jgi:macrolide transport system ATP-binding/permease protein
VIYLLKGLIPLRMLAAIPYLKEFELNAHVLLLALATEVTSAVPLSLIAILRAPLSNLQPGSPRNSRAYAGTVWWHLGANMVVLELCMATILLVRAGCRTFYKLLHTEIGLHPDHLATLRL